MSTTEEKKAMIPMNYYNESNGENEYCKNMRFLGITPFRIQNAQRGPPFSLITAHKVGVYPKGEKRCKYDGYPLLFFELENGKTVIRQLFDNCLQYNPVEYK